MNQTNPAKRIAKAPFVKANRRGEPSLMLCGMGFRSHTHSVCPPPDIEIPPQFELVSHIAMCNTLHMATNLALDDSLIEAARKVGKHRTKKEAVTAALGEYIQRRKQLEILDLFGKVDFDHAYNYKAERRKKRG